ncbi:hypothetical protein PF008_g15380 [Phytophthora fragariae]|uniref:Uncharacterized protein n=1 Tax=Phytophthora fragariae TaxID=53985 RepID=A0A6G0RET0_9STRA|nr:hypothetical protein PF008_g15380 [Phytophthora fragariae]
MASHSPPSKMASSESSSPTSASEAVEAARKRKHRELVKRSYYQKLEVLGELRQQEKTLASRHSALLRYVQSRPPVVTLGGPTASVQLAYGKYVQATSEKERQVKANATLRRIHSEHLAFQKKLATASAAEERKRQLTGRGRREPSKEPESDSDASSEKQQSVQITPVSADACYEVMRAAYAQVCDFRSSRELYTSKQQVLGWTHRYRLEGENLQYSIAKIFSGMDAQELSDRGWAIMTTESSYKALHSRGMTSNLHDIQTVNEDNRVFCRELQRPDQRTVMRTLFLSSHFQTAEGSMTIYRALDHEKHGFTGVNLPRTEDKSAIDALDSKPPEPHIVWLDMFAWTSFENRSDGSGVEFQFGGEMKHFSADNAKFWMMEVLLMALRWESRAIAPLITLQG